MAINIDAHDLIVNNTFMQTKKQQDKGIQWLGFLTISFFILTVYSPSLMDGPRADQFGYLADLEVEHKTSLWDLTLGSIDFDRHRQLYAGDQILFRPLLYIVLGTEEYFFSYHYVYWQAFGILLHVAVIWVLLRLLLTIYYGWEAVFMAAFFTFLFVNIEMVIWQHINSYMIFIICVLIALRHFYMLITTNDSKPNHYLTIFWCLLLGAFCHEMVNAIALIIGIFLWKIKPQQRLWTLCILAVPAIYLTIDIADLLLRPCHITFSKNCAWGQSFSDWFIVAGNWICTGLFPFEFKWLYGPRTTVLAVKEFHMINPLDLCSFPSIVGIGLIAIYGTMLFKHRRRFNSPEGTISLLVSILIGTFVSLIDIGRVGQHAILQVLYFNTYYMYIFWIFTTVVLYALIDWGSVNKRLQYVLCILTVLFILINSFKLYEFNEKIALKNLKDHGLLQATKLL